MRDPLKQIAGRLTQRRCTRISVSATLVNLLHRHHKRDDAKHRVWWPGTPHDDTRIAAMKTRHEQRHHATARGGAQYRPRAVRRSPRAALQCIRVADP
jgi:hypothetical protein